MHALIRKIQEERYPNLRKEQQTRIIDKNQLTEDSLRGDGDSKGPNVDYDTADDVDWGRFLKNNLHIAQFAARPNMDPQDPDEVSMAFGANTFHKLVRLLENEKLVLRQKALFLLIQLFLQKKENVVSALEANIMDPCVDLVDDPDIVVRENALSALGFVVNVKKGSDLFIKEEYIQELKPCIIDSESPVAERNALRVMKNLSRQKATAQVLTESGCIPLLVKCISEKTECITVPEHRQVLLECLHVLKNVLAVEGSHQVALASDVFSVLNKLLTDMETLNSSVIAACRTEKDSLQIIAAACTCVTYLCFNNEGVQAAVSENMYKSLIPFLRHPEHSIRMFSIASLTYITMGKDGKYQCLHQGVIPIICHIAATEDDSAIFLNNLKLINNMSQCPEGRQDLLKSGVMRSLEHKKENPNGDKSIMDAIEGTIKLIRWRS